MANYARTPIPVGAFMGASVSTAIVTQALSASATWLAYGFQARGKTLNSVRAFLSATAGSLIAADVTCSLYSDSGGAPNASIEGPKSCGSAPSGSAWYDWTGFTTALTGGTQYWLVFKNANGTPGTNFPTFRLITTMNSLLGGSAVHGDVRKTSTDSGSTWAGTSNTQIAGFRLGFSDSTYGGLPLSNYAISPSGVGVYSARELGSMFTTPANASLKVIGIGAVFNAKTGTPTGNARFRLYTGASPSLLATTDSLINASNITGVTVLAGYFSAVQTISASTIVRAVLGETTQSDASTARFNLNAFTVDTDAASLALMPFGSFQQTYFDGSTWGETSSALVPIWLLLDDGAGEFASGGGGVQRKPGNMNGGF